MVALADVMMVAIFVIALNVGVVCGYRYWQRSRRQAMLKDVVN